MMKCGVDIAWMTLISAGMMVLVLIIHLPVVGVEWYESWREWMVDGVCRWAVPWFFLVSGVMFGKRRNEEWGMRKEWLGEQVKRRVGTLLVPFFVLNVVWLPVMMGLNWIGTQCFGYPAIVTPSWHWVVRGLGLSPFSWPIDVPTWFLRALFVVVAIEGLTWSQIRFTLKRGIVVAMIFWGVCKVQNMYFPEWKDFFTFGINLHGIALFSTGMLLAPWLKPMKMSESDRRLREWTWSLFVLQAPVLTLMLLPLKAFGVVEKALGNPFAYAAFGTLVLLAAVWLGHVLKIGLLRAPCFMDKAIR